MGLAGFQDDGRQDASASPRTEPGKGSLQTFDRFIASTGAFTLLVQNLTPSALAALSKAASRSRRSFIFQFVRTRALLPWLPMIRSHFAKIGLRAQGIGLPCLSLLSPTTHSELCILETDLSLIKAARGSLRNLNWFVTASRGAWSRSKVTQY